MTGERRPGSEGHPLASLKAIMEEDDGAIIRQTDGLAPSDLLMIGTVVQLFCLADLNGRRIVDVLRHAALGEPRAGSRLQDAQVFPLLERLVREHLWEGDLREGLLKASSTFEMHRVHRHNFAHWVARRVRGANALVLLSMNSKEAERRDGSPLSPMQAKYGIVHLDGFAAEVEKMKGHGDLLAMAAARLEEGLDDLRTGIAARRSPPE